MNTYHVLNLVIVLVAAYIVSLLLVKSEVVKLITHRRFWNFTLLVTFLVMGLLGILLAVSLEYKISLPGYSNILWFHVEFGIAMTMISIFHILWHWRYFFQLFPRKTG